MAEHFGRGGKAGREERGQAGIVGAALLVMILVIAFSSWYATVLPRWKRQEEAEASARASEAFRDLRSKANLLALKSAPGFSLTTTLDMKGSDIPLVPDGVRQGRVAADPGEGSIAVTRYWGDGEPVYQEGGGFGVSREDAYYTGDGTATGDKDWYPQRSVKSLSTFEVSFSERTEGTPPSPAQIGDWHEIFATGKESKRGAQTFVAGESGALVKVTLYLKKVGSPGELTAEIRDCAGANNSPGNNVLASITTSEVTSETGQVYQFTFTSQASVTAGTHYSIVLHESKGVGNKDDRYLWAEYRDDVYPEGKVWLWDGEWKEGGGGKHDFYFKAYVEGAEPVQPEIESPVHTDLEVKLLQEGERVWEASFREGKKEELKIDIKDEDKLEVKGYFDPTSKNYHKSLNLLNPRYGLSDFTENGVPCDIQFEHGDKAYGTYTLAGDSESGMWGKVVSESWKCNTGVVNFDLRNNYYVDQVYAFESGGVILEQGEKLLISQAPQIRISTSGGITSVYVHDFDLRGPEFSISGSGTVGIEMWFKGDNTLYQSKKPKSKALLIEIRSRRKEAWKKFLVGSLEREGLEKGEEFLVGGYPGVLKVVILGTGNGESGKDIRLSNLSVIELGIRKG